MIHQSLKENNIDLGNCYIVAIENQFNVATWASYLKTSLPHFDKVYSGNEYVVMLLDDSGYTVVSPNFLDRTQFSATKIRQMIANDGEWEQLVSSSVAKIIKKINGVARIKTIFKTETKPQEF